MATLLFSFQSRNRGSFDFKAELGIQSKTETEFQSRNRGSFDFKTSRHRVGLPQCPRFNLVIEVLLISSDGCSRHAQSPTSVCFNLVIEVLLISSEGSGCFTGTDCRVSIS